MIFEKLVNHYFNVINEFVHINEQPNTETIAMIPGSFKPPHKGHYAMIEHFSNISDRAIVIISDPQSEKSIRRTPGGKKITSNVAREILEIYTGGLSNVELVTTSQPVKWVYDFMAEDTTPGQKILLGVSGKGDDANRYLGAKKYAPEGVEIEASVFTDSDLNVSASTIRQVLDSPTLGEIDQFLPAHLTKEDKDKVLQILSQLEEQVQEENSNLLNIIQTALDVAGLEPTIGTVADGANTLISGLRAATAKEPDEKKKHIINMGISAVSMLPFGDVAKLVKIRSLRKPVTTGLKAIKSYTRNQKLPNKNRFNNENHSSSSSWVLPD